MPNASGPMACPVDGAPLVMTDRSGIEIDYCPTCRGVWLDRGELDKIIERNAEALTPPAPSRQAAPPPQAQWDQQSYGLGGHHGQKHYKRRKSFLSELFD